MGAIAQLKMDKAIEYTPDKEAYKLTSSPKVLPPFASLGDSTKLNVHIDVMDLSNVGKTLEEICVWVAAKYKVACDDDLKAFADSLRG